jgi:hypothetical protein
MTNERTLPTKTAEIKAMFPYITLAELQEMVHTAHGNAVAAWRVQSNTTEDDGYTAVQAQEAMRQAIDADGVFSMLWDFRNALETNALLEAAKAELAELVGNERAQALAGELAHISVPEQYQWICRHIDTAKHNLIHAADAGKGYQVRRSRMGSVYAEIRY